MTPHEKQQVERLTEWLMRDHFGGKKNLKRMRSQNFATDALQAWEDMFRSQAKSMVKFMRKAKAPSEEALG